MLKDPSNEVWGGHIRCAVDNARHDFLTSHIVRHRQHRHFGDIGHRYDDRLELLGGDIFTGAPDHVLHPSNDAEIPSLVLSKQIARPEPLAVKRGRRGFGIIVVAEQNAPAPDEELAHFPV